MKHFLVFLLLLSGISTAQWGAEVGTFNNVKAYSNGNSSYFSGEYNSFNSTNTGLKWQCVEYCNRYYASVYGMNIRIAGENANQYFSNASARGLQAHANGGGTPPKIGDILCSSGGQYGHVAIIREVGTTHIKVIQQNWSNNSSDNSMTLSFNSSTNTVSSFSASYPIQGWLRKPTSSGGFVKVKSGVTCPSTVVKGVPFNISFSLKEIYNGPITLGSFAVSVHKPDNTLLFDVHLENNLVFAPSEEKDYSFSPTIYNINTIPPGNYTISVKGKMTSGWFDITVLSGATNPKAFTLIDPPVTSTDTDIRPVFELEQNYPNPFNPSTSIGFTLGSQAKVRLIVVDMMGQEVSELINGIYSSGSHHIIWNAAPYPSGIYHAILFAESAEGKMVRFVRKLTFIK